MHLFCAYCGVYWADAPRCWLCDAPELPGFVKLTSGQIVSVRPLPPLPGDVDDPVFG